jgi:hypothetical protein
MAETLPYVRFVCLEKETGKTFMLIAVNEEDAKTKARILGAKIIKKAEEKI